MIRIPVIPTIVVALAVAAMIALGFWQLDRRTRKEAALARYATNARRPAIAFPRSGHDDGALFRRSAIDCVRVAAWQREGGRDAGGGSGWRQLAECATGAAGPRVLVQMGVARSPDARPAWSGGTVTGRITYAPDHRPLLAGLWDHAPRRLLLIADRPAPGLAANAAPDLASVPNNHLAYAVQWFFFAGVALVIYGLAVRRRAATHANLAAPTPYR